MTVATSDKCPPPTVVTLKECVFAHGEALTLYTPPFAVQVAIFDRKRVPVSEFVTGPVVVPYVVLENLGIDFHFLEIVGRKVALVGGNDKLSWLSVKWRTGALR